MNFRIKEISESLWSRPEPVLAKAGVAVEPKEGIVGLSLTSGTFFLSVVVYFLISREYNPSWLGFASSSLDVTLISGSLVLFLFMNEPHTAVNSKVIFEGYFLAIAGTGMRYDKRICITAGLLAFAEYFAIVYFAATHWDLNSPAYSPYPYGVFGWAAQISRFIILLIASALSLSLVSRSQKLLQLATSDQLTGLFNRGYVDDRFAIELSRARRYGTMLTVAVIDADRFKLLNDTYGHSSGDLVLRKIGVTLRESFRQSDTAGRYGGEEFVVVLPETDIEAAHQKLEAVRNALACAPVLSASGAKIQVTISAGLASFPEDGGNAAELFSVADERMFLAKRAGRNRVVGGSEVVATAQIFQDH